jgi:hypothetical protein
MNKLTTKAKRAIKKYGEDVCIKAFKMHHDEGMGGNTVGFYLNLTTRQADAAIDAGRELSKL